MTAARVLNPVVLSEFCKMRASPAAALGRNLPCGRQLNRIKRDLFGPSNPVETNKIFNEELEKHQECANKKWGFDFRAGNPLSANSQFIWERVGFQESSYVPEMYTLTRAAHVRPNEGIDSDTEMDLLLDVRAERENFGDLPNSATSDNDDSCYDSQDDTLAVFKMPACHGYNATSSSATPTATVSLQLRKRQPKITEYMKERKRLAQTPKKLANGKRMRTNSGSSSSISNTVAAYFSAHKRHRQQ